MYLFVIGISLIALRYTPFFTDDAAYHYKAAYLFQDYENFFDWFSNLMLRNIPTEYEYYNFPLFGLLLYIFSGTGTYSLVSFVVSLLVYISYTSILFDIYKKNNISKLLFLCTLITIIIFVNVRYTTSGMRFSLAVALTILLFYKEIENNDNLVLMKISRNFEKIKKAIIETGNKENAVIVSDCGKDNEVVYWDIESVEEVPYFSTMILKKKGVKEWKRFLEIL